MRWLLLCFALVACDETPSTKAATSGASSSTALPIDDEELITVDDTPDDYSDEPEPDAPPAEESCAPKDPSLKRMQVLRFTWASGVEGRDPKDRLYIARPGQRVFAHMRIRNRSGRKRCLKATFRVGGKKRTEVTLNIGKSWNWRTWAYNTVRSDDKGPLHLRIADDQGNVVLDKKLAVVPE